jgi:hypothetical protein
VQVGRPPQVGQLVHGGGQADRVKRGMLLQAGGRAGRRAAVAPGAGGCKLLMPQAATPLPLAAAALEAGRPCRQAGR